MTKNVIKNIKLAKRTNKEDNVWVKISNLIDQHSPLDLAVGKPNIETCEFIKNSLKNTQNLSSSINQYTRSMGHPRLVNLLTKLYSQSFNETINPFTNIVTTIGADGSIFCASMALIEPGDEVIIFQPYYDSYASTVLLAQGIPVFDGCKSTTQITFDKTELENAFSSKTKMLILNTPHNPTGKIFDKEELQFIANLCIKHNVVCLNDVVYDRCIYTDSPFYYISTFEGMWERTLTIASAGKAFNVTGWKLGWTIGPDYLITGIHTIHSICNYTAPSVIQEAIATCIEHQMNVSGTKLDYWENTKLLLKNKRDKLINALEKAKLNYIIPESGYFVIVDMKPLIEKYKIDVPVEKYHVEQNQVNENDMYKVATWLIEKKKISGIPLGPFYNPKARYFGNRYIRFCFVKPDDLLDKATQIIETL